MAGIDIAKSEEQLLRSVSLLNGRQGTGKGQFLIALAFGQHIRASGIRVRGLFRFLGYLAEKPLGHSCIHAFLVRFGSWVPSHSSKVAVDISEGSSAIFLFPTTGV